MKSFAKNTGKCLGSLGKVNEKELEKSLKITLKISRITWKSERKNA